MLFHGQSNFLNKIQITIPAYISFLFIIANFIIIQMLKKTKYDDPDLAHN